MGIIIIVKRTFIIIGRTIIIIKGYNNYQDNNCPENTYKYSHQEENNYYQKDNYNYQENNYYYQEK